MENDQTTIFVLILNYRSAWESIELYRSIRESKITGLTILIIDNDSGENDINILKKEIPAKNLILANKNFGYAGGNNKGIRIALEKNAEYIWILNPDIRIKQDALSILIKTMKDDKELAAIGPRILRREEKEVIFTDGELLYFDEKCTTVHKHSWQKNIEVSQGLDYNVDYIDGSCILLRAEAIKDIGLLPEQYFLYFEETHWCFLAKRKGWKLAVNSNATVFNLTSEKKGTFHYYFMRNRLVFCKEFHDNFRSVRTHYGTLLIKEIIDRLKKKAYLKPYFKRRLAGYLSGVLKTL